MKAFIFSSVIILFIFAITLANGIFVQKSAACLIDEAQEMQMGNGALESLTARWSENRFFVSITTSQDEILKIDDVLAQLKEYEKQSNKSEFYSCRALLIEYLVQIKGDEELSLNNII